MNRRPLSPLLLSLLAALFTVVAIHAQTPAPLSASTPAPLASPALSTKPAAAIGSGVAPAASSATAASTGVALPATGSAAASPAGPVANTIPTAAEPATASGGGPRVTWSEVRVNGPFIAMTFDDGPHPTLTPQLLDMLKQRGIHATFFVLGSLVKDHPEILKRAVAEGHEIGNHSWDHPNLGKMSDDAVRSQLLRTRDAIAAAIGKASDLMRPPYGSVTAAQKKWFHDELGLKIILWSVDPLDWKNHDPATITRRIAEGTRSGGIVLAHDIHKTTVEAMPETLDGLLAKGFKFVTVSQLLAMELPPEPKKAPASGQAAPRTPRTLTPGVPEKITGTEPGAEPPVAPSPTPAAATPGPTPKQRRR